LNRHSQPVGLRQDFRVQLGTYHFSPSRLISAQQQQQQDLYGGINFHLRCCTCSSAHTAQHSSAKLHRLSLVARTPFSLEGWKALLRSDSGLGIHWPSRLSLRLSCTQATRTAITINHTAAQAIPATTTTNKHRQDSHIGHSQYRYKPNTAASGACHHPSPKPL
jgi:hypothetical protein